MLEKNLFHICQYFLKTFLDYFFTRIQPLFTQEGQTNLAKPYETSRSRSTAGDQLGEVIFSQNLLVWQNSGMHDPRTGTILGRSTVI